MRVSKPMAIFGFHFCTTIFIGLSAYGLFRYLDEGLLQSDSFLAAGSYAAAVLAAIAGIGFFGREADRRRAEEAGKPGPAGR
jgi:hypothetical protein